MGTKIRLKVDSGGIRKLLNSGELRADLTSRMSRVASAAQAGAEVASGSYRNSIHVEQDTTDRAVVRVVADVPYAVLVESRTGNLARALDSAG